MREQVCPNKFGPCTHVAVFVQSLHNRFASAGTTRRPRCEKRVGRTASPHSSSRPDPERDLERCRFLSTSKDGCRTQRKLYDLPPSIVATLSFGFDGP